MTPRDLLLKHYVDHQPQLDRLRRQTIESEVERRATDRAAADTRARIRAPFAQSLWRELFWVSRRVWLGLAAAWVVILTANLAMQEPAYRQPTGVQARAWLALIQEQQQLMAELDQRVPRSTPATTPPPPLRPHSQRRFPYPPIA